VRFRTADGGTVVADLYAAGRSDGVVLAHGAAFDKASWTPLAGVGHKRTTPLIRLTIFALLLASGVFFLGALMEDETLYLAPELAPGKDLSREAPGSPRIGSVTVTVTTPPPGMPRP
jgi:hypothetical protein